MKKRFLRVVLSGFLAALPSLGAAQAMDGFGRTQLIKFTPNWKGERFPDGRPRVPDNVIQRLKQATSEEAAWGPLRRAGYTHQWDGGWMILNPKQRLVGRVFTCQYMPGRQEINEIIEAEAQAQGLSQSNVRVMDMLKPGDVVIADHWGDEVNGVFTGDNLAVAIWMRTGNGYIVNGGIRDWEGTEPHGFPVFFRKPHPGTFPGRMLTGVNVPIRVGNVTVMPGDVVIGDQEGLTFVPPHLAEAVADHTEVTQLVDQWRHQKFIASKGAIKPSDLYGAIGMRNPDYQRECHAYVEKKFAEKGRKVPPLSSETNRSSLCAPPDRPAAR